jgi:chromosome segregation ATPase
MSENLTQQLHDDPLRLILARLDSIDSRIGGLEDRMSGLEDRMSGLEDRMTALEEKVDRRLQETRPIWEQVLARLGIIEGRMDSLENEMRLGFREVKTGLKILNEDILQVRVAQRDLETRTARLESESAP